VLDLEAVASGSPVVLSRPADGVIALNIIYGGSVACQAQIKTTAFASESGSVKVDILTDCGNPTSEHLPIWKTPIQPNTILPVCLYVPPLPTATQYSGRLIIQAPGLVPLTKAISVVQPAVQQGTLILDHTTFSQTVSSPFCPRKGGCKVGAKVVSSVVLREKTNSVALYGISVRLEEVSGSPDAGLDLKKNIEFRLDDNRTVIHLDSYPTQGDGAVLTIKAGGQAAVGITLKGLRPGDYSAILRFSATNSVSDDAQKLQINVHVRASVWWAVILLIIALVISFISTKVLTNQIRRAKLLQNIRALEPEWLASFRPIAPVVWVSAVLHQSQMLSKRYWLTSPNVLEANVNSLKNTLSVLDTAHQLRQQLKTELDSLLFKAAVIALDEVISRIETSPLTDSALQSINADLGAFNDWLNRDKFASAFWKDLQPRVESLLSEMGDVKIGHNARDMTFIRSLKDSLQSTLRNAPQDRATVEKAYRKYAQLQILWDQRRFDDLGALFNAARVDIEAFFKVADKNIWRRIEDERASLAIRLPSADTEDGLEAYRLLRFAVETEDPLIKNSYLFRYKVTYQWTFNWKPSSKGLPKRLWHGVVLGVRTCLGIVDREASKYPLNSCSIGPSIVRYFQRPGEVNVSVKLHYLESPLQITTTEDRVTQRRDAQTLRIHASSDFGILNILFGTEFISWFIAAITAVASGLAMFYYKETSWGTYQDYLTLALWGIGLDQGKNFLQALQAFSPQAPDPTTGTH